MIKFSDKQTESQQDWRGSSNILELLYDGGARSGKTYLICLAIWDRATNYPESRHLIARYRLNHMTGSVWKQTLIPQMKEFFPKGGCSINEQEKIITLPNGATIWGAGLDDKDRVEKIMGTEYATIFINEATQISFETFQKIKTRLSQQAFHREDKSPIVRKIIVDCNPRSEHHWLYKYFILHKDPKENLPLPEKLVGKMKRRHWTPYDNPFLPKEYFEILEGLIGIERQRLLEGQWVNQEGLVYPEFAKIYKDEPHRNVIVSPFPIPEKWETYGAVDFGFRDPFVFLWFAKDPSNEVFYLFDEIYESEKTVRVHSIEINKRRKITKYVVADHDAEDRATLAENGIPTIPAEKDILTGIQDLRTFLTNTNGYRLKVFSSCVNTIEEAYEYSWEQSKEGKNEKEKPVDYNNHAMDALRYFAKSLLGAKPKATVSQSKPVASNKFDWNRFNQDRVTRMTRK